MPARPKWERYWRAAAACARRLTRVEPWPPQEVAVNMLVLLCKNSSSLKQYFSQLRSVLRLARCELGALSSTSHLVKGAWKRAPAAARFRARATPEQARGLPPLLACTGLALRRWVVQAQKLIAWARDVAGRAGLADYWTSAWQVC